MIEGDDERAGLTEDVLVLCYHAISASWPAVTAVPPAALRRQLECIVERGYTGMTFTDALTAPSAGCHVVVTFDDAHRSVLEHAKPILDDLGLPATVFAPTDHVGTGRPTGWDGFGDWIGTPHEDELVCLDWDELRGLRDSGWEIGSHTRSHPRLSRLTDQVELDDELMGSKARIEAELGAPCHSLAYPYSAVDRRVIRRARAAGYAVAATVPLRLHSALPLLWPRVGVFADTSDRRFKLLTSSGVRRILTSPVLGEAVERVRGLRSARRDLTSPVPR